MYIHPLVGKKVALKGGDGVSLSTIKETFVNVRVVDIHSGRELLTNGTDGWVINVGKDRLVEDVYQIDF